MSSADYNKIITTVNSVTPDYSFIPNQNDVIVIDTSNNRIGINTITPEHAIDVSGGMINTEDLTVHGDISVGCVNSHFVPCIDLSYDLGTVAKNWRHLYINEIRSKDPLTIDPEGIGNNTGNVIIKGNLEVQGTQTIINSTIVDLSDNIITLDAQHGLQTEGGIEVRTPTVGVTKKLVWHNTNEWWSIANDGSFNAGSLYGGTNLTIDAGSKIVLKKTTEITKDQDVTSYIGRAAIGYNSNAAYTNWASFSHLDMNNATQYCLLHSEDGITYLNTASGKRISFRINDVEKMKLEMDGTNLKLTTVDPLIIDSGGKIELKDTTEITKNEDVTSYIGRAAIGYNTFATDWASFSHLAKNSETEYSLLHSSTGTTYLNTTDHISFRINNVEQMKLEWDGTNTILGGGSNNNFTVGPLKEFKMDNTAGVNSGLGGLTGSLSSTTLTVDCKDQTFGTLYIVSTSWSTVTALSIQNMRNNGQITLIIQNNSSGTGQFQGWIHGGITNAKVNFQWNQEIENGQYAAVTLTKINNVVFMSATQFK